MLRCSQRAFLNHRLSARTTWPVAARALVSGPPSQSTVQAFRRRAAPDVSSAIEAGRHSSALRETLQRIAHEEVSGEPDNKEKDRSQDRHMQVSGVIGLT
ncbi:hypothetical protein AK812_SmicGene5020 [Symbiodinium microadriaticum]|uniref:Uncharacterized protein n=1 Tax=Symbiodinium microadriaticum TaxID=2951 RepID=A0A1Q9EUS9_SYMMI|nr:hypothetical protein AK812_SmicGene5020 [Symbiodinium microadriaticum]